MALTQGATFWNWTIRGIGGVINIMESYVREDLHPSPHQLVLLEYQLARVQKMFDALSEDPSRTYEAINSVRSFGPEEVLEAVRQDQNVTDPGPSG